MSFPVAAEMLLLYAGIIALALVVVLGTTVFVLSRRLKALTRGKNGVDLEATIAALGVRTDRIEIFREELEEYLRGVENRLKRSLQGIATVRFNPFGGDGTGGNQSFATALIDEEGTGVVISTLYARERMSVFGKPLVKGASPYELTEEEREAVRQAAEIVKKMPRR